LNSGGTFDLNSQQTKLESLKKDSLDPTFWNNKNNASSILKNISRLENNIKVWSDLEKRHGDITILFEFYESGEVEEKEVVDELNEYEKNHSSNYINYYFKLFLESRKQYVRRTLQSINNKRSYFD